MTPQPGMVHCAACGTAIKRQRKYCSRECRQNHQWRAERQRKAAAIADFDAGMSRKDVAEKYGYTYHAFATMIRRELFRRAWERREK